MSPRAPADNYSQSASQAARASARQRASTNQIQVTFQVRGRPFGRGQEDG